MTRDEFDWVDKEEERQKEGRSKDYFNIVEGKQQFFLLSHFAPLPQVWDNATKKYRIAEEGDKNISMKGICWVLQDGVIKSARMPYTVVKSVRAFRDDPEWEFAFPFKHQFTLDAKGAGTKEVEYTLTASPKRSDIPQAILDELEKKASPEEIVEKIKSAAKVPKQEDENVDEEEVNPADIPF